MDEMEKMAQDAQQTPEQDTQQAPEQEAVKEVYVPRPAWQVWGARVALLLFILVLVMYYVNLLKG
jgi:hypothetical protein